MLMPSRNIFVLHYCNLMQEICNLLCNELKTKAVSGILATYTCRFGLGWHQGWPRVFEGKVQLEVRIG